MFDSVSGIFPGLALWIRLPALISWSAVSCGIIISTHFQLPEHTLSLYIIVLITATASVTIALFTRFLPLRFIGFLIFASALCFLRQDQQNKIIREITVNQNETQTIVTGSIVSLPVKKFNTYKFILKTTSVSLDSAGLLRSKNILCLTPTVPPLNGTLRLYGKLQPAKKRLNRYDFDESVFLMSNGIRAKMVSDSMIVLSQTPNLFEKTEQVFRNRVISVLDHFREDSHRAILLAAFLNEREYLSSDVNASFRKSGIFHLLSISGLHAGMLIGATYMILSLFPVNITLKHIISLLLLWLYQLFIGFIPSLFRATLMATLIIVSLLFQKKNYSLQSLGLAGTVWLLISPESLFMPGYQLSFAATFGIIVLSPVFSRLCPQLQIPAFNALVSNLFSSFSISFAGFLSTAPILLYHFGSLSLYGLVANLAAVSLMSVCMWSFFASLIFESLIQPLSQLAVFSSSFTLDLICRVAEMSNHISLSELVLPVPHPEITVCFILLVTAVAAIKKTHLKLFLIYALPVFFLITPLSLLLRSLPDTVQIERFYGKKGSVTAVKWPHRGVWLYCADDEKVCSSIYEYSIRNWIRHHPLFFLERVCLLDKAGTSSDLPVPQTDNRQQNKFARFAGFNLRSFFPDKNEPYNCHFLSETGIIRLEAANTWVHLNSKDTVVFWGVKGSADTLKRQFPAVLRADYD